MLFTFPSRYWFTIGLTGVFSLAGWARQIHTGLHVSRATQDDTGTVAICGYGTLIHYGLPFQAVLLDATIQ